MALETKLAKLHMDRAERRDPNKTYNKIDIDGLKSQVSKLDWNAYFEGTGHSDVKDINVDSVAYLKGAARVLAKTDVNTLRDYLRWNLVRSFADQLPKAFVEEKFAFYGKTLRGQDKLEVRWKRCTSATNRAFRHPLGRLYVEREFEGDSKAIALDLIQRIEAAFAANLPKLEWMDDTTRERATEKMKAIYNKVGYPDKWRSYEALEIKPDDHFANTLASRKFEYDYRMNKIGKPVDRDEWRAGPPVVNASYSGTRNEMWFPAGILQAPFFDKDHPMAMNFGGIGVVMGHELTHGFDDQGRKYDGKGVLREWWEKDVIKKFEKRTQCVDDLYGKLEVEPGHSLNGKLTLGENVADMGGVKQAYMAYKKWAEENEGDEKPHVEGLTNDQLLFVAFAQVWCEVSTPEYLRVQVATDPHSPARFRGSIPLSMTPEFAEAFACAPETPMNPKDRCEVW
jgi:predicted metalloendopeptidase